MPLVSKTFSQIITFTRASSATYFDAAGVLQTATTDVPRFDYDPSTLAALGFLIEESRTNSIRNNTMQGAATGTPGTLPTNWTGSATVDGLSREVVGTGTENGISYIDVRFSGTSGAAGNSTLLTFEGQTQVVAANGQTWTTSVYLKLAAGALTNVALFAVGIRYNNSGGTSVTTQNATLTPTASLTRYTNTLLATDATTAFVNGSLVANFTDSSAVDFTVRIGLPQLEQGAFATSVIPTTTTAVTRADDVASVNTLAPWFNAVEGTLYVQAQDMSDAAHASAQPRAASLNDGTTSNRIDISRLPASAQARAAVFSGGASQFNSLNTAWPLSTQAKIALAYKAADFAACLGGGTVASVASGTVPTVSALTIGNVTTGGSSSWVGWIQRITYYPRRLSNAELQSITT